MVRTLGVEEELLLVDPGTGQVVSRADDVLARLAAADTAADTALADHVDHELFRYQVETRTDPARDLAEVSSQLRRCRRRVADAAGDAGVAVAACGTMPLAAPDLRLSDDDRYRDMLDTYREIGRTGGTCAMHVHVGIDSDEQGVQVIDALAPWLPLLIALSANSPFYRGRDTGYASFRTQVWGRWPSAGPTEPFGSAAGYRAVARDLVELGGARDAGMLYFDARLSAGQPTVEIRVADVCTDADDAVVVAALVRALVTVAADGTLPAPAAAPRVTQLRAAQWRASRYGLSERLVDPVTQSVRPAEQVLDALVSAVAPALEVAGDAETVAAGIDRIRRGSGASRQRAAFERSGELSAVVADLVARTV